MRLLLLFPLLSILGCQAKAQPRPEGETQDLEDAQGAGGAAGETASVGAGGSSEEEISTLGGSLAAPPTELCDIAAQQESDFLCRTAVSVDSFSVSSEECWVDSPLAAGDDGQLQFSCGAGPADLVFPNGRFVGSSNNCSINLTLTTQFAFGDGCTWQSQQTISGSMEETLSYTYSEAPIAGVGCASPCSVSASLKLEPVGDVEVEPPK